MSDVPGKAGAGAGAGDLASLRGEIDGIDDQILSLLDRRAEVVKSVGDLKRRRAETFHVPGRERAVLERLTAAARGAFPREGVRPVFREIMSACLSLESPLVVAYPGPEATFSHLAGKTRFGLSARYLPAAGCGAGRMVAVARAAVVAAPSAAAAAVLARDDQRAAALAPALAAEIF